MDAFLTPAERAVRQRIRDYLRNGGGAGGRGAAGTAGMPERGKILSELSPATPPDPGRGSGLLEKALLIEEVSAVSPKLGRDLLPAAPGPTAPAGAEGFAAGVAWSIGTAAGILEACMKAAREQGLFASTLMGCQETQMGLGELLSGLEAARLQSYRALRLIDGGEKIRGEDELEHASGLAGKIYNRALTMASSLLGAGWLSENMPDHERSR